VCPLLKDTIQGLDVPGATLGVPPGDKTFRRKKTVGKLSLTEGMGWGHLQMVTHLHVVEQPQPSTPHSYYLTHNLNHFLTLTMAPLFPGRKPRLQEAR
jgi:hypothetical protein